jgi:hypothetical protein
MAKSSPALRDSGESFTGFRRFAICLLAGNFQVDSRARPLFYAIRSDEAYEFPNFATWIRFRNRVTLLVVLIVFATTSLTPEYPYLYALQLSTIPFAPLVLWLRVRRLPRTSESFRADEASRVRRETMSCGLAIALAESLFGWAILSSASIPLQRDATGFVLAVIGGGLLGDGVRRLQRRAPAPPGVV